MTNLIIIVTVNELIIVLAACLLAVTGVVGWLVWRVWCMSRTIKALWTLSLCLLMEGAKEHDDAQEAD